MRIVDLFCGIGGVAEAVQGQLGGASSEATGEQLALATKVVSAIDVDRTALSVYAANHGVTPQCTTLESIRKIPPADLWWLSPPCQPYTVRGKSLGARDPRSQALANLIGLIDRDRPEMVALENVPAFDGSDHHQRLLAVLDSARYAVRNDQLCPTSWGVPMRRRRFYLLARRDGRPIPTVTPRMPSRPLGKYLDTLAWHDEGLHLPAHQYHQYRSAINVVDADQDDAIAACFTSAYGRSPVRSGSYVQCRRRGIIRRFSAAEIARLLGFERELKWPSDLNERAQYRVLGNSLSVTVVRALLKSLLD